MHEVVGTGHVPRWPIGEMPEKCHTDRVQLASRVTSCHGALQRQDLTIAKVVQVRQGA